MGWTVARTAVPIQPADADHPGLDVLLGTLSRRELFHDEAVVPEPCVLPFDEEVESAVEEGLMSRQRAAKNSDDLDEELVNETVDDTTNERLSYMTIGDEPMYGAR